MLYREYPPHAALRPFVRCFWSIVSTAAVDAPVRHRVLPDGCLDIIFMGGPGAGASQLVAAGAMTTYIVVDALPVTLGVRFEPGCAAAFLRSGVTELTDRQVDLWDFWGADARRLHDRLQETTGIASRVEQFYAETFGLVQKARHDAYAELGTGATTLAFAERHFIAEHLSLRVPPAGQDSCEIAIVVDKERVDRVFAAAVAHGATAVKEPVDQPWGQRTSYVRDPDQHLVEICSPAA